jgi:hypothetical protein
MRSIHIIATLAVVWLGPSSLNAAPEAFEVGPHNKDQLPGGKEADGIIGDFLLRNDKVEAVISHNAPNRRANMSTFYGPTGVTPGCLYDLTLRGQNNDQITVFAPAYQQGTVTYVRVVEQPRDSGESAVETVITAANNNGLYKRHVYRLRDGWQGVLVVTTLRNESDKPVALRTDDRWTNFRVSGTSAGDIIWADAIDPADKAGYAYGPVDVDTLKAVKRPEKDIELPARQEMHFARFLAVGRSPAEAVGVVAALRGPTGVIAGTVKDAAGGAVTTAAVTIGAGAEAVTAYPDAQGAFTLRLPPGSYNLRVTDIGRETVQRDITLNPDGQLGLPIEMSAASAIEFDITDDAGRSIPCKAQFIGQGGTKNPDLGPRDRAHGCVDQYHSEKGKFRVQVPPGVYKVVVTRGIEYTHLARPVTVEPGKTVQVKGSLRRVVQTPGWVSADFHNHSTQSGDNTCGTDDRIINLAAEHIEYAPTTEHNRLYDWRPHIERLELIEELNTVPGLELTGSGAHINAIPFEPVPFTQDRGAPVWNKDPRLNAVTLRDWQGPSPDRWIQINHPDMVENFIDRDGDGRADGGYMHLGNLIDGIETENGVGMNYGMSILAGAPFIIARNAQTRQEEVRYVTEFVWLQLLNRGHRMWGVAVCDAHSVYGNGVGGWRMYLPSASDKPPEIQWKEISRHAKAGRMVLTTGPYLEVETIDGVRAGGTTRASGSIDLKVRVQCTDWLDIDRVQVLVNGRQRKDLNFTRKTHPQFFSDAVVKFDQAITVPLSEDAHLIVVATGENGNLSVGYGTSPQAQMRPVAYNNPIFVDTDGNGFTPNGDTLGYELPVKKLTVEDVKKQLAAK